MKVIAARSCCSSVTAGNHQACLMTASGTSDLTRERALSNPQTPVSSSCSPETRNESAVGEGGKYRNAEVNSHSAIRSARRSRLSVDHQPDGPTSFISAENTRPNWDIFRQRSMNMNPKTGRHALESDEPVRESDSTKLMEAEAIETSLSAKARKPRLGDPSPHSPEEPLLRIVNPLQRPTLQVGWNGCGLWITPPSLG